MISSRILQDLGEPANRAGARSTRQDEPEVEGAEATLRVLSDIWSERLTASGIRRG